MTIDATSNSFQANQAVATSSIFGSQNFNPDAMTPDALLLYLSTRLGSVDNQIQGILDRQKQSEKVRSELGQIQKALSTFNTNTDDENSPMDFPPGAREKIEGAIASIHDVDPGLADRISETLASDGQIFSGCQYTTAQLEHTKDYLGLATKDIESGAQMDMINLQSMMGARQTAIQLSTNLVSALSESAKAVVTNIR